MKTTVVVMRGCNGEGKRVTHYRCVTTLSSEAEYLEDGQIHDTPPPPQNSWNFQAPPLDNVITGARSIGYGHQEDFEESPTLAVHRGGLSWIVIIRGGGILEYTIWGVQLGHKRNQKVELDL